MDTRLVHIILYDLINPMICGGSPDHQAPNYAISPSPVLPYLSQARILPQHSTLNTCSLCPLLPARSQAQTYSSALCSQHLQLIFLPQREISSFIRMQNAQNYSAVYFNIYNAGQQTEYM
jgi:hypothetical protein